MVVLGVDIGTTSVEVGLYAEDHSIVKEERRCHSAYFTQEQVFLPNPAREADCTAEQDVDLILQTVTDLISQVIGDTKIEGVAVAGQMHGIIVWDENFEPCTNLITWEDRRITVAECAEIHSSLQPGYGVASLSWIRTKKPQLLEKAISCGTIMDYFVGLLTSTVCSPMSPHNAQSFGCYSKSGQWLIEDPILPPVDTDYEIRNVKVHPKLSSLKSLNGAKVLPGLGDHQCSIMAQLVPDENVFFFSFGTSSQCTILLNKSVETIKPSVEKRFFHPKLGYLLCAASMNGGNVINHFARLFDIKYDDLVPSKNPVKIQSCQLFPERGESSAAGVGLESWNQNQSKSDFIYGLGQGIVNNLIGLMVNGCTSTSVFEGINRVCVAGGAKKFTIDALSNKFPGAKLNKDTTKTTSFGAALFYFFVRNNTQY